MEYCLIGTGICATWTDGIPFWELLISGIITLIVTAGTIWASVSVAAWQTRRQLEADQSIRKVERAEAQERDLLDERERLAALIFETALPILERGQRSQRDLELSGWGVVRARFAAARNSSARELFAWADLLVQRATGSEEWAAATDARAASWLIWPTDAIQSINKHVGDWVRHPDIAVADVQSELEQLMVGWDKVRAGRRSETEKLLQHVLRNGKQHAPAPSG